MKSILREHNHGVTPLSSLATGSLKGVVQTHDEGMPNVGQQVPLSQGVTHEISTDDPRLHFF